MTHAGLRKVISFVPLTHLARPVQEDTPFHVNHSKKLKQLVVFGIKCPDIYFFPKLLQEYMYNIGILLCGALSK